MEKMEAIPQSFTKDPVFMNLNRVARYAALNENDKIAYKKSLKAYRDAYAIAQTERAEGRAEGLLAGMIKVAIKMKASGRPIEEIMDVTELPIEEIQKL